MTIRIFTPPYFAACKGALEARVAEALEQRKRLGLSAPEDFDVRLSTIKYEDAMYDSGNGKTVATTSSPSLDERDAPPTAIADKRPRITLYAITALMQSPYDYPSCERIKDFHKKVLLGNGYHGIDFVEAVVASGKRAFDNVDAQDAAWRAARGMPANDPAYEQRKQAALDDLPGARNDLRQLVPHIMHHLSTTEDVFCLTHEIDHVDFFASPARASFGTDERIAWLSEARAFCIELTDGKPTFMARLNAACAMRKQVMSLYVNAHAQEQKDILESDMMYAGPTNTDNIKRAGLRAVKATARAYIHQPRLLKIAAQKARTFNEYCRICEGRSPLSRKMPVQA